MYNVKCAYHLFGIAPLSIIITVINYLYQYFNYDNKQFTCKDDLNSVSIKLLSLYCGVSSNLLISQSYPVKPVSVQLQL